MTTELEACKLWIDRDFNSIPQALVKKAFEEDWENIEILAPTLEAWIKAYGEDYEDEEEAEDAFYESEERFPFPMWGWYFQPSDPLDADWFEEHAEEVYLKCGVCVYCTDETGIMLGINGAGYNFYDSHWLPLYRLRGLKWHDEE